MPWLQLSIECPADQADYLSGQLTAAGALSVSVLNAGSEPVLEPGPGETPVWARARLVGLFSDTADVEHIRAQLAQESATAEFPLQVETLADQQWERVWLQDFHPVRCGQRLWICPAGERPEQNDAVCVQIDPGLAFGTGTHATTKLCLAWLDQHPPANLTVIDYGCGSGILAIAAAKLGARHVIATDHDDQALCATRENAERNGVSDRLEVCTPAQLPAARVGLLLANILSGPLLELAPRFGELVHAEGTLVLSGILAAETAGIEQHYHGRFGAAACTRDGDWARIVFSPRKNNR